MQKKTRRLVATILTTLLLVTFCSAFLQAYAWTNICCTSISFPISGGTGNVACTIEAYTSVTKVTIKANLQQKVSGSWKTIATWEKSADARDLLVAGSKALTKGYDYRVEAIFTAKSSALTETVTLYSTVRSY